MSKSLVKLLYIPPGVLPIFEQLCLEEALLRTDDKNWVIINPGMNPPSVVMGVSGVVDKLVYREKCKSDDIPVIKRFTGGGTVITDHNTLFVSFIMGKDSVEGKPQYPKEVMKWSETFYKPVFDNLSIDGNFWLKENDYCLGEKKVGGNAQSISRDRWVHHTSFLFDFFDENMGYLKMPEKRPEYRRDRPHSDFLTRLKEHIPFGEPEVFKNSILQELNKRFDVEEVTLQEAQEVLERPQERKTNSYVIL